jgi:hypothetical protein
MKGNSTKEPDKIVRYKEPAKGQIRFLIERLDDNEGQENWQFQYAEINGFDTEKVTTAIVRSFYSTDKSEMLMSSFTRGENIIECMRYQNTRVLADAVAAGKHLKSEVQDILDRKIIEIRMPFNTTLAGGDYAALADYALKAKLYSKSDPLTNSATVYCSYVLPDHRAALEADPRVQIVEHDGIVL